MACHRPRRRAHAPPMTTSDATTTALPLAAGRWTLDPAHSTASFWIRHLGISRVRGRFNRFDATLEVGATLADTRVRARLETASVDTGNADRDAHLRAPDLLDVERYPDLVFTSTAVAGTGGRWALTGDLTILGTTREVTLDVELGGVSDAMGAAHAGFTATASLDRRGFGVPRALPPGADGLLGSAVHVDLDLQLVPADPA